MPVSRAHLKEMTKIIFPKTEGICTLAKTQHHLLSHVSINKAKLILKCTYCFCTLTFNSFILNQWKVQIKALKEDSMQNS